MLEFKNNYINENIKDIVIKHDDSKLEIILASNLDLYIYMFLEKEKE